MITCRGLRTDDDWQSLLRIIQPLDRVQYWTLPFNTSFVFLVTPAPTLLWGVQAYSPASVRRTSCIRSPPFSSTSNLGTDRRLALCRVQFVKWVGGFPMDTHGNRASDPSGTATVFGISTIMGVSEVGRDEIVQIPYTGQLDNPRDIIRSMNIYRTVSRHPIHDTHWKSSGVTKVSKDKIIIIIL